MTSLSRVSSHPLPASADVVVVGGGVTGCATVYSLARAGADVLLLEQYDLNTQASGRNAGSLHGQIQQEPFLHLGEEWARRFLPALRLLVDALDVWAGLSAELGVDLEVSMKGGLLVAETDEQLRDIARKVAIEQAAGMPARLLDRSELRELAPYASEHMVGGELMPLEGKANSLLAAPALAAAAERHGARVVTMTAVRGLAHRRGGGFLLRTSSGEVACRTLVLTAGTDLPELGRMLGVHLAVSAEPVQVSVTEPVAPLVPHLVYFAGEKLTLKQARSGALLIGGGWPARPGPHGPVMNPDSLRANLRVAQKVVPSVGAAQLLRTWVGVGNGTPDHRPLLGEVTAVPGLIVGMFPYMGLTAGPLLGRLVADLVLEREPGRDLEPFRPDRF